MKLGNENQSMIIKDFEPEDILSILRVIVDIRYQSIHRDLVFNKSLANFLISCSEYLETADLPDGYHVPIYQLENNSQLHNEIEQAFCKAILSNFGDDYTDFGETFVEDMRRLYYAPFRVQSD